jgi:hypothetical protein
MKSQVNDMLLVLLAICEDVRAAYPACDEVSRDIKRLTRLCQTRGLGFLSLDLPMLDDFLLEGLEQGVLPTSFGPFVARSKRCKVPRLFTGLWLRVFDNSARLKPNVDFCAVAFLRQLAKVGKKVRAECSPRRCYQALEKYYEVESSLRTPSLNWQGDQLDPEGRLSGLHLREVHPEDAPLLGEEVPPNRGRANILLSTAQQYADLVMSRMSFFFPHSWSDRCIEEQGISGFKHGPGVVAERLNGSEKSEFLEWPARLEAVFPFSEFGRMPNDEREPIRNERPSRLCMVPKTLKSPRIICAEPVAHQWCQQAILGFLNHEITRLFRGDFIDFRNQGKSGSMVLKASSDRRHSTIDLSDASDRLSCFVIERLFRRNPALLSALHAARTRYVEVNYRSHKRLISLKKFATQGTAVTFPVQSLAFLFLALAASHKDGPVTWKSLQRLRKDVRVYGDDIIVPTHGYEPMKLLLHACYLKVNDQKSFSKGWFRESCGTDGYGGYDVTPVQPKVFTADAPGNIIAVVDTSNNLYKKGFWHASAQLLSHVPVRILRNLRILGPDATGAFGAYSYSGGTESHLRKKWNSCLHRYEVRTFGIVPKVQSSRRDGYPVLLDFSSERSSPLSPRVKSEYRSSRYSKGRVRWEPANGHYALPPGYLQDRPRGLTTGHSN